MPNVIRLATLFSGIGAPEVALSELGVTYETVLACEIDKFARKTYLHNLEEPKYFFEDVKEVDGKLFNGKIDLLVGGSPCTSFSITGLRKGVSDPRGQLIYEFVRLVDEIRPKIFVFENVKNFLSIDKGETYKEFLEELARIGYNLQTLLLNAKDYGDPQNRERVFIVGSLKPIPELQVEKEEHFSVIADILDPTPQDGADFSDKTFTRTAPDFVKPTNKINLIGIKDFHEGYYNDSRRVFGINGLCKTLTTMQGGGQVPTISYKDIKGNTVIRELSVEEMKVIQGFPKDYELICSVRQNRKQIGNSMSIGTMKALLRPIIENLKDYYE